MYVLPRWREIDLQNMQETLRSLSALGMTAFSPISSNPYAAKKKFTYNHQHLKLTLRNWTMIGAFRSPSCSKRSNLWIVLEEYGLSTVTLSPCFSTISPDANCTIKSSQVSISRQDACSEFSVILSVVALTVVTNVAIFRNWGRQFWGISSKRWHFASVGVGGGKDFIVDGPRYIII